MLQEEFQGMNREEGNIREGKTKNAFSLSSVTGQMVQLKSSNLVMQKETFFSVTSDEEGLQITTGHLK